MHASSEHLLPVNGSGGRSVRYFADHELKTVDSRSEYAVVMVHGVSGGNTDRTKRVRALLKQNLLRIELMVLLHLQA